MDSLDTIGVRLNDINQELDIMTPGLPKLREKLAFVIGLTEKAKAERAHSHEILLKISKNHTYSRSDFKREI